MIKIIIAIFSAVGAAVLALVFSISSTFKTIESRFQALKSLKSSVFYAVPPAIEPNQVWDKKNLKNYLESLGLHEKKSASDLLPNEFSWGPGESLVVSLPESNLPGTQSPPRQLNIKLEKKDKVWIVQTISDNDDSNPIEKLAFSPKVVASYLAGRIRTQKIVSFSEIPLAMRQSVMAIEDTRFLQHHGMSLKGIVRAFWNNLVAQRTAQGGSTITQQLMKNLFFSSEKSLSRKIKEAFYAFLTELKFSKEDILEAYLNEVYLGQEGTHEIHGVSEGARFYFNRGVEELSLAQSALLAGIIQAPNAHDPRRHSEKATKRRNLVLRKMFEEGFIVEEEYKTALEESLGVVALYQHLGDLDYFLDLAIDRIPGDIRNRIEKEPLSIFLTVNPWLQIKSSAVISDQLKTLQEKDPALNKLLKKNILLQGALIAINPSTCEVLALQGGSRYRVTQFNRILQGKRQVGSLFKPFVALASFLESKATPQTELEDSPFEWQFDQQLWKPKNYDNKFRGKVTLRDAIEQSINIPTARLAQLTGIEAIAEVVRKAGIESTFSAFPSISLGAVDATPYEVARSYVTLANLGKSCETLNPIREILDENGNLLYRSEMKQNEIFPEGPSFQTVNIMKGTFTHGTAKWAQGQFQNFAGKTGTTNEAKDAWFVGFSPQLLVLVWVGFDTEQKVGLTGAAAALPVWSKVVGSFQVFLPGTDFKAPAGLRKCSVRRLSQEPVIEYFSPGTEPRDVSCEDT